MRLNYGCVNTNAKHLHVPLHTHQTCCAVEHCWALLSTVKQLPYMGSIYSTSPDKTFNLQTNLLHDRSLVFAACQYWTLCPSMACVACRTFDPNGKRTVGVVTKVDLAEPGIRGRLEATGADQLRLELGYVAVCRQYVAMASHPVVQLPCCAQLLPLHSTVSAFFHAI